MALKSDGTVWDWGYNGNGELGNGTNTSSTVPVQVSGLSGVTAIAAGGIHAIAVKSDGTVWDWGGLRFWDNGHRTRNESNVPVQVINLSGVTAIVAGSGHTLALKSDGTVWDSAMTLRWMSTRRTGQTLTDSNFPVPVSNLSGVIAIAGGDQFSVALKSDGTVWDWGDNTRGQLGNGGNFNSYSNIPVQVSNLGGVTAIAAGGIHTLAVKSDGTVWDWGNDAYGQLGNGIYQSSNVPVQVLNLSNVTAIAGGEGHSVALVTTPVITPTLTVNAVNITYGTALANNQLTGTSSVPGTFTYTTDAGKTLNAGNGQTEVVTFTPTDAIDYASISTTVTVNVAQATPTVTVNPINITYGTALDNSQLTGTSSVFGSAAYTTDAGKILNAGIGQSESVTFTPTDTTDYTSVSTTVTVNVAQSQATPTATVNAVNITYGIALANSQLTGTSSVPGSYTYTTDAGKILNAGNGQTEDVTFTPTDTVNYQIISTTVPVNVALATLTITATTNSKIYDAAISAAATPTVSGLIGADSVSGLAEVYADANAGIGKTLNVSAFKVNDGNGGNNYAITTVSNTTGLINKASLTITAIANTKTYDSTTTAAATPTVSGLVGADSVTGLAEVYGDKNPGRGKTLSVSAYTVSDSNHGNNYSVIKVINTTGVINLPPIGNFVSGLVPGPNGFTASFSQPLNPAALTLYGTNLTTPQDVTLRGSNGGLIHGSLIFDPSNMNMTFVATASYLLELNSMHGIDSAVLPDDTYTIMFLSGSGSNGFLFALDGVSGAGLANYTTTFTTSYQHDATPVLGIPDFARGPDSDTPIEVPNIYASGIPITLYNAASVTDVTFSLSYNPALLSIGAYGGAGSDATDQNHANLILVSNSGGLATFHYTDPNPISATATSPLVLGDITAVVPSGPGAAALSMYQVKELLQLGNIVINGNANTGAVSANAVHVNAYFGDVNGDKVINGLDTLTANMVAQGHAAGFSAYSQVDPVIIGDVAGDNSIDAGDVTTIDSFVAMLHPLQIPMPPTQLLTTDPKYVNPGSIHSPNAADPTLSLTRGLTALGSPVVSVMIDHPDPEGSTGLTSVTLALTYDPKILSVTPADITLGSIPSAGSGWQMTVVVDQTTGQIGIQVYSLTPITVNQAGSLVNIAFQLIGEPTGVSPRIIQLVDAVIPYGQWFGTGVADSQGAMILSPWVGQLSQKDEG